MKSYNYFKSTFFLFLILAAFFFGFSETVTAQDDAMVVQSVGTGIIRGTDIAAARDEALSEAMVSGVQRALSDLVPTQTIVSNFKKIDETVYVNIADYILEYKVLAENTSGKTYRVMVESTIFAEKIKAMISSLETVPIQQADLPRIIFFLAEQNIGDILPNYWWGEDPTFVKAHAEKAAATELSGQGYSVMEHEGSLLYQSGTAYINNPYLKNEEALELGRRLEADIVVVGTAMAQVVPGTAGQTGPSFKAEVAVRALKVDTGEEMASVNQESVASGVEALSGGRDALTSAGTLAGKALATSIAAALKNAGTASSQIEILVRGTSDLATFVNFRKSLAQVPGVKNLRIKETMGDEASLLVDYEGSAQTLADTLMQSTYENFGFNIFEIGHKHISMDLLPGRNVYRQ